MTDINLIITMYIIGFLPLAILNYIMPSLLRKNVFFGVSVPNDSKGHPMLKDIFSQYKKSLIVGTLISTLIYILVASFVKSLLFVYVYLVVLFGYIAYIYIIYVRAWNQTKKVKQDMRWDVESKNISVASLTINNIKNKINAKWFLVYPVLIIITSAILIQLVKVSPDQIPINFDIAGNVLGYTNKGSILVYVPIITQVLLSCLMFGLYIANNGARVDIDPDNKTISEIQTKIFKYRWSMFLFLTGVLMNIKVGFSQIAIFVPKYHKLSAKLTLISALVLIVYAIALAITTGQSGNRVKVGSQVSGKKATKKDDDYWKYGMFYYNKNDPSLFVEKRVGIGYTLNFAKTASWVFMGIIGLILVGSLILPLLF